MAAAVMMPAATATVYALTVHSREERLPPISLCTAGNAVITTSESSAPMKNAADVSTSAHADRDLDMTAIESTADHLLEPGCEA